MVNNQELPKEFSRAFQSTRKIISPVKKKSTGGRVVRIVVEQPKTQVVQQPQQIIQPPVQQREQGSSRLRNFITSRSSDEVFGGGGLTVFDSEKTSRNSTATGNLFGF